jgi:hypothetical protein
MTKRQTLDEWIAAGPKTHDCAHGDNGARALAREAAARAFAEAIAVLATHLAVTMSPAEAITRTTNELLERADELRGAK